MASNGSNEYNFEPNTPEEIYMDMLIPAKFKNYVKQLILLTGKNFKEISA
jgi:hypothetical protein